MYNKWHIRFLKLAQLVSTWSKDPSTKIGCVLVKDRKVVATGYNGFPPGIEDNERLDDRRRKYPLIVHGEMNALIQAGHDADGSTLYLWGFDGPPCQNCTKHLITAGIAKVVVRAGVCDLRWQDELNAAEAIWKEAGIEVHRVEVDDEEAF